MSLQNFSLLVDATLLELSSWVGCSSQTVVPKGVLQALGKSLMMMPVNLSSLTLRSLIIVCSSAILSSDLFLALSFSSFSLAGLKDPGKVLVALYLWRVGLFEA